MDKIIFFDVDDTLIDAKTHQVPLSTWNTLHQLKESGYFICIATGRSMSALVVTGIHDQFPWDAYVLSNGQCIYDKDRNELSITYMDDACVRKCLNIANANNQVLLLGATQWFTNKEADYHMQITHEFLHIDYPPVRDYQGEKIINLIAFGDPSKDFEVYQNLEEIKVIIGQSHYADIILNNVSKFEGIKVVLDYYHMKDYIAFGDSMNDYEMFEHAALSIAMGQGDEKLKKIADFITKPVYEDGIEYAYQTLKL